MLSKRLEIALAIVLVVLVVVVGGVGVLFYEFTRVQPESIEREYSYELWVQPDARLENVTLYVPLPIENGTSSVGEAILANSTTVRAPGGWTYDVVDAEYGPMLAIETDAMPPKYENRSRPIPIPTDGGPTAEPATPTPGPPVTVLDAYRVTVELPANATVDTRSPVDSEPTLRPRLDARAVDCDGQVAASTSCGQFSTQAYLSFDAPANSTTELAVSYEGGNSWFAGGWTGNSFDQRFGVVATGSADGWVVVPVDERVGVGTYPTPGNDR